MQDDKYENIAVNRFNLSLQIHLCIFHIIMPNRFERS